MFLHSRLAPFRKTGELKNYAKARTFSTTNRGYIDKLFFRAVSHLGQKLPAILQTVSKNLHCDFPQFTKHFSIFTIDFQCFKSVCFYHCKMYGIRSSQFESLPKIRQQILTYYISIKSFFFSFYSPRCPGEALSRFPLRSLSCDTLDYLFLLIKCYLLLSGVYVTSFMCMKSRGDFCFIFNLLMRQSF